MDFTTRQQRHLLSGKPAVALVYGGIRNGGSLYFGNYVRIGAWNGAPDGYDLSADLSRIHLRIFSGGLPVAARLLSSEPYHHLQRARPPLRPPVVSYRGLVFSAVKDDGCCCAFLCGLHHPPAVCVPSTRCSFCRHRGGHGVADMALHA